MRTFLLSILLLLVFTIDSDAQLKHNKQLIQFSDKAFSPYSIHKPQDFLSPAAIARRQQFGIPITIQDLPVNPQYLKSIEDAGGEIYIVSKWFNACVVKVDSASLLHIQALPFVIKTEGVGPHIKHTIRLRKENRKRDHFENYPRKSNYYGHAETQIKQMNGQFIHQMGYKGEGVNIAVLDGGFTNVDIMPFFDSLRAKGKLHVGKDMVDNDDWLYESSSHGSNVLSTMAANLPGLMVGTAPESDYYLIKTEEVGGEFLTEEWNWIAGVEWADSAGTHIVNSSLGYTEYNDDNMSYRLNELDGITSPASIAADIAHKKGMIIVSSAGNSGNSAWKKLGVPSDAMYTVAVGSIDKKNKRASFSSIGPSADGRVKPNLSSLGYYATVASIYSYEVEMANGTSFSSPILAGMMASFWQAFPEASNDEIIAAFETTAHQANRPDSLLGFGIPNVIRAYFEMKQNDILLTDGKAILTQEDHQKTQLFLPFPHQWESAEVIMPHLNTSIPFYIKPKQHRYTFTAAKAPFYCLKLTDKKGKVVYVR